MQPIERYGVVALLFLVATFTAVLVMGEGTAFGAGKADQAKQNVASGKSRSKPSEKSAEKQPTKRMRMTAGIQPTPLKRDSFPDQRAMQEEQAAEARESMMQERALRAERELEREMLELSSQAPVELAAIEAGSRGGFARAESSSAKGQFLPREEADLSSAGSQRAAGARAEQASALRKYKVKPGDTLGEIALAELGTSKVWKLITEVNPGLTPSKLIVNRTILLPTQASVETALAKRSKGQEPAREMPILKSDSSVDSRGSVPYTVLEGESLWRIAQRQLGSGSRYTEIIALNPSLDPNKIRVGQSLVLPAAAESKQSSVEAPSVSASIAQQKTTKRIGRVR